MRNISSANLAALQAGRLVARDFLWIVARDRSTGAPVPDGMWSDVGSVTASVVNPDTGVVESRDWYGSGNLVQISDIPQVSDLSAEQITIQLSQVSDHVNTLVRTYDCKQARVEIYRGLFDPDTRQMVAPAECRFAGFVDKIEFDTPSEGDDGQVTVICNSHSQELQRSNPDTRSDASQRLRSSTDNFFQDAAVVGDWEFFWGRKNGKVDTASSRSPLGLLR